MTPQDRANLQRNAFMDGYECAYYKFVSPQYHAFSLIKPDAMLQATKLYPGPMPEVWCVVEGSEVILTFHKYEDAFHYMQMTRLKEGYKLVKMIPAK